jgi:hypothetical protein
VSGKAVECFDRGLMKSIISSLSVGGVRKIKTSLTDSAIRKNGYMLGMTLSIKKSGFNQFMVERVA